MIEFIEFGFDYFLDVDDDFLLLELGFIFGDFLSEGFDEGVDGVEAMEVGVVILPGAVGTDQGSVLAAFVHADEVFREVVVFAFAGFELEVADHRFSNRLLYS